MKNSPDPEWFNKLEKRLREYTEEPDANIKNKIASKIGNQPEPLWILWANRSAALISLLVFLWSGLNTAGTDVDLTEEPITNKQSLSGNEGSSSQADKDRSDVPPQSKLHGVFDDDKIFSKKNNNEAAQTELKPHTSLTNILDIQRENEKTATAILFPQELTREPTDKNEMVRKDSLNSETLVKDSLQLTNKKTIIIPGGKKRVFTFYASLSPSLSYLKITPLINDGVVIDGFNSKHIFSTDRLGVSLEAGIQSKIGARFEFYGGLSIHQQSHILVYQYQSGDHVNVIQEEDFDYALTPGTMEKQVKYNMLNLGASAGVIYYLRGDRLTHKIGAGLSYQHGMRQVTEGETYNNSKSQYLLYQIFYRNEYTINNSASIFIQPFYKHAIVSKEHLNEPFKLKPYRAGLSIGVLYNFR